MCTHNTPAYTYENVYGSTVGSVPNWEQCKCRMDKFIMVFV